jgi:hypothetical protein
MSLYLPSISCSIEDAKDVFTFFSPPGATRDGEYEIMSMIVKDGIFIITDSRVGHARREGLWETALKEAVHYLLFRAPNSKHHFLTDLVGNRFQFDANAGMIKMIFIESGYLDRLVMIPDSVFELVSTDRKVRLLLAENKIQVSSACAMSYDQHRGLLSAPDSFRQAFVIYSLINAASEAVKGQEEGAQ